MNTYLFKRNKAFTLIELLVVIGALTVLLSIVLIIVNPSRQFSKENNAQRVSDVNAILNAIYQYKNDNENIVPNSINVTPENIGSEDVNICNLLVPLYLIEMPVDPTEGNWRDCDDYDTGYLISISATGEKITVSAPSAELSETISVGR